ncbi:hypothetical protein [Flavobacterium hibernum]|uniref:YhhN-like protein n=1 Tax=Flavobacterium hibernum TaxID=37752 RepID=A0A0D0F577_9FLAO|nr:hypothetical protein [Flavobacterium hibernum]KIO54826.1 hypothetical protein IW18_00085 [Flavobacterium hibernum]OXA84836.1 hypothetical protein B0A73_18400 [Flavobacterium hibernum]STO10205.1 Uncharacterised protein [Flavobacterium hibernum]
MDDFLIYSGYLILLLNLILYSYSFFRKGKANVFFVSYLAFAFVMQCSLEILYRIKINNLFAVNIFFIGQMILLGLFYNSLLPIKSQKICVKTALITALFLLAGQFMMDSSQFLKFNLFEITLTSLLIVAFALLHFYNMLTENKKFYYVSFGTVFYLLGCTVLFLIGNFSTRLSDNVKYLSWMLNAFLFLVYHLFILYEWKVSFYKKVD